MTSIIRPMGARALVYRILTSHKTRYLIHFCNLIASPTVGRILHLAGWELFEGRERILFLLGTGPWYFTDACIIIYERPNYALWFARATITTTTEYSKLVLKQLKSVIWTAGMCFLNFGGQKSWDQGVFGRTGFSWGLFPFACRGTSFPCVFTWSSLYTSLFKFPLFKRTLVILDWSPL